MVVAIAAIDIHRAVAYDHSSGFGLVRLYTRTDYRADSLLVGALLAQLWVRGKTPTRGLRTAAWIALAFVATCIARVHVTDPFLYRGGYTMVAVGIAVILLAISGIELDRHSSSRPGAATARSVGFRTASTSGTFPSSWPSTDTAPISIRPPVLFSASGSREQSPTASWALVERPILRWKRRNIEPAGVPETELPRI